MISILCVDDEQDLLEVAQVFLEESKEFKVRISTSAKEALDSASITSYDAIVSDYQMPGMNGIDFLKEVRRRFGDIPFILFTGRGREEVVIDAINNGADFYLQKGGEPEAQFAELTHKIRQAVARRRAEHQRTESEKRLLDIINFLPDATFAIDKSGHVISWNRAMEEMTGRVAGEMLGKGEYEYAVPLYGMRRPILIDLVFSPPDEIRKRYSSVHRDREILTGESLDATPKGKTCILWGMAAPLYNNEGAIVGAIESIRDITERRQAEEALRESERRYRNLYQYALVGLFETSLGDGKIVACNQRYCNLFGFASVEDALGNDVIGLYDNPKDRKEVTRLLHTGGSVTNHVVRFRNRQTGQAFWAQFSARLNREKDVAEGTIIDITEMKRLEADLSREHDELQASCKQLAESERTLRINEERLVMAQEIGCIGSWEYRLNTDTIWGSAEGLRIFGFPPVAGDFPITEIEARIPDRERVHQALVDLITKGDEYNLEYGINPADGSSPRVIHAIARLENDAGGNPLKIRGVIQDITERKRGEDEIAFKNIILSTQQETTLDAILIADENGKILNYNQNFIRIWGVPDSLIAAREDAPVLHYVNEQLADPEAFLSRVRYLYDHKEEKSFEELLLKDGRVLERFSAPMLGADGRYFGRIWYFRDIGERKQAEAALRESESRLSMALDVSNAGIWEWNLATDVLTFDDRFHALLGYAPGELPTAMQAWLSYHHPEDVPVWKAKAEAYLRGDSAMYESEHRIRTRAGSWAWIFTRGQLIHPRSTGSPNLFIGIAMNVTGRRQAEEKTRESEAKFYRLHTNMTEGAALHTLTYDDAGVPVDYVIVEANPAFEKHLGISRDRVIGKTSREAYGVAEPPYLERYARVALTGEPEIFETYFPPLDRYFSISAYCPAKGSFATIFGDITARRKADAALKESEAKYRDLAELLPQMVFELDTEFRITYANRRTLAAFGFTEEDIETGINALSFISPSQHADVREMVQKHLTGVSFEPREYTAVRKDGNTFSVLIYSSPIFKDNSCTGFRGVVVDISARKKMEEDLVQRNEDLHAAFEQLTASEEELRQNYEELQKNEQVLRESEQKFSTVFQGSPIALTLVSAADGTFADVNEAFVRNTGYSRDDVIGKTAEQLGLFPNPGEREALIAALRSRREIQGMDLSCRIRSGEIRACLVSSRMILMGETPHILSTIDDITGRRETEEALKESEAKFRRLAENAPDMIYRMSLPAGNFEYVSPASLALTGYTPEEFYADPSIITTLIHPAWREYSQRQWTTLLQGEVPPAYEYQIIDRAGTTHWINQRNMVVRDEQGQMVALEGIATDITRQKEIEQELKRSELRSLAANENAGSLIWEVDANGLYRYASPAVLRILGYRPDELVGSMHFYDLFDPAVRDQLKADALAAFRRREPFRDFVNLNRHKNGTEVILTTSAAPVFDEDGAFTGYCGVDENITQRTAAESAIQAIVRSIVGTTGLTSLRHITENISSWLGADCVMIGEILPDKQTVKVLSMLLDGKEVPDYRYTLKGTPCEHVMGEGFCLYEDNVRQLFPHSKDLVDLNIRGYIGTPMRNSAGQVFGILCALSRTPLPTVPAVQDIMDIIAVKAAAEMERMQMERALTEHRKMLAKAMDIAHLANWEFDIASGIFTFDDRFYALYGTTAEREGGTRMPAEVYAREFVHPDELGLVVVETQKAIDTTDPEYTSQVEHRIIRRDGEIRTIVVSIRVRKNAEGRTLSTYGVNQDITDIRRAEATVRETEGRFRSLVETSPGVIWEVDMQGRFQYISPIVKTLLGYEPEELIGESITVLVIERLQPTVMKILENFVSSPDMPLQPFEIIARHRDGHDLVMEIRPSRVADPHGMLIGFRGVAYDTTERKKAEEALKRANRQLTLMSSITRHDLLNKITVILGNLKLAERECTDTGQEEYLKKIRYATSAIKAQIEFTRIYQNLGTNEPQWLNLDSMMPRSHVPDTMSLHAEVRGIQIHADPMLERVFFNLLDNAIRHGESVTEIRVSSHQAGSDLVVVWEDNGIGIAPEDKDQIFDRGFGKNTGLGLFLVREILSLTGITIRETGEPLKGARFEIVVPQGAYEFTAEHSEQ